MALTRRDFIGNLATIAGGIGAARAATQRGRRVGPASRTTWGSSALVLRAPGWMHKPPTNLVSPVATVRSNVFYVGEAISFTLGPVAVRYEVRNYYGNVVDGGPAAAVVVVAPQPPGWYKLYVYGRRNTMEWGRVVGGTMFAVFRDDPHFPKAAKNAPLIFDDGVDPVMRGVTAMGPSCMFVERNLATAIKVYEQYVSLYERYYVHPGDPVRPRPLAISFDSGARGRLNDVKKIVEHFKDRVQYWQPRSEPDRSATGAEFVKNELIGFYKLVKGVDPRLKVLGPAVGSIGLGMQPWLEDFFKAGGGRYIDAFSFHANNCCNGDLWLERKSLQTLMEMLKRHGMENMEKWQTQQGYFAACYGAYQPRLQGRWTMLQMMVYEQYGIPKEHNCIWYDMSHGYWDYPAWWENDDTSLNPAAPLMRVWSEELFGTHFTKAFDFGGYADEIYVGSLFGGPQKSVATFMTAGDTRGKVHLKVSGPATRLRVVSAFGMESEIPVVGGHAVLDVPELPVYVQLSRGQTLDVLPHRWGRDLALQPGVSAAALATGATATIQTSAGIRKIYDNRMENWYWSFGANPGPVPPWSAEISQYGGLRRRPNDEHGSAAPWTFAIARFPVWVRLNLAATAVVRRVVVFCAPPWQAQGTLLDFELQYRHGSQEGERWITLDRVHEPTNTFAVCSPTVRCMVDKFASDRWIFQLVFAPVKTDAFRLFIHNSTWGGSANRVNASAGGQGVSHPQFCIREIRVFAR